MFSSFDHVIRGRPKYTIFYHEIWANYDPSPAIFLGSPKILKPVLATFFQGLLPGKVWTMSPDPKGVGKNFAPPQIFWGEGSPMDT